MNTPETNAADKRLWLESVLIRGDEFPRASSYPFDVPALQGRQELSFSANVVFLVGENGAGKSTLIEAVARRCGLHLWSQPKRSRPGAGSARSAALGSSAGGPSESGGQSDFSLPARALSEFVEVTLPRGPVKGGVFSAESFREWAEFIDDVSEVDPGQAKYHGGEKLTLRSRGEGLLAYFRGRYRVPGLYFLDEPEAALSPASQLELLRLLSEYRRRGHAQFVIAPHSPLLMAVQGAQVFVLGDGPVTETAYQQTEHYRLFRDFFADPGRFAAD
jgi:predicted ATPase